MYYFRMEINVMFYQNFQIYGLLLKKDICTYVINWVTI